MITAWLAALTFVINYLRTAWFRSQMGRHVLLFMSVILIVLTLATVHQLFGDFLGRDVTRLISYSLINVIMWRQAYLLIAGQRAQRRASTSTLSDPEDSTV